MIEGALDLADSPAKSIMTPRPLVAWLDINESLDAILSKVGKCPYAQLLVSRDSIDEVVGMVRKQDLLDQSLRGESIDIKRAVRSPLVVPEGTSILRALDLFRATLVDEALVVYEFGSVQGIVTRTDPLEAVAGDLAKVEGEQPATVTRRSDGSSLWMRRCRWARLPNFSSPRHCHLAISSLSAVSRFHDSTTCPNAGNISRGRTGISRLQRRIAAGSPACSYVLANDAPFRR
jgi:CBS domain containing-hemolysin-like protein